MSVATSADVRTTVRDVLERYARLRTPIADLDDEADLYAAGLTSRGSVSVMLGVEDAFDVEIPDDLLQKSTFATVSTIAGVIASLLADA